MEGVNTEVISYLKFLKIVFKEGIKEVTGIVEFIFLFRVNDLKEIWCIISLVILFFFRSLGLCVSLDDIRWDGYFILKL